MKRATVLACLVACIASANAQTISGGSSPAFVHPGYIANDWYSPLFIQNVAGTPVAPGTGTVVCGYGAIGQTLTLSALGARITTLSAGGNVQLAVYANGSWGKPGALIASTASISTTSAGVVNSAVSVQVPAGSYWFCENSDNATSVLNSQANANPGSTPQYVGTATQAAAGAGNASNITGLSVAQTFGTWPAFTSGTSWTEVATAIVPMIVFKVASVP